MMPKPGSTGRAPAQIEIAEYAPMSEVERARAQHYALLNNLGGPATQNIIAGQFMMLFAADVLAFDAKHIGAIIALAPVVTFLRIPLLRVIQRLGRIRSFFIARLPQTGVVLCLFLLPAESLTFVVFTGLILSYLALRELGPASVWSSLTRELTTDKDLGRFLANTRFSFTVVSLGVNVLVMFLIGNAITEGQYKFLLGLCVLGLLNSAYWIRRLPAALDRPEDGSGVESRPRKSLLKVARTTRVLRLPLLITILISATALPLSIVYFRQMLNVPANLLAGFVFTATLGQAISFFLWGRISDTIGFRPMLIGLLSLAALASPILFLVPVFPATGVSWLDLDAEILLGLGALFFHGFLGGFLASGVGIATTSVQLYHVSNEDSLEAMNLFAMAQMAFQVVLATFAGFYLSEIAIPWGTITTCRGLIHFDWFKAYLAIFSPVLLGITVFLVLRLPNVRPWFGVGHFFTALVQSPVRTIYVSRDIYHENISRRTELARWFGIHPNPMSIDPLLALMDDPYYEVRVEAIRSLAHSESELAGEKLLESLADPERRAVWDHCAWALGILRYQPAVELLTERLSSEYATRVRALSARSLGKLGNRDAIPALVRTLDDRKMRLFVVSACCQALLELGDRENAGLAFHTLHRLTDREERFEMMTILCEWLELPTHWILSSQRSRTLRENLIQQLEWQTPAWRAKRSTAIAALKSQNHVCLQDLMASALDEAEAEKFPVARDLLAVMRESKNWSSVSVLAAAWLLFAAG